MNKLSSALLTKIQNRPLQTSLRNDNPTTNRALRMHTVKQQIVKKFTQRIRREINMERLFISYQKSRKMWQLLGMGEYFGPG